MISNYLLLLTNHIWQSTLFAAVVWLVTLALRNNRAAVRHRLWLVASVKLLIPFSLLTTLGSYFPWQTISTAPRPSVPVLVETISGPFSETESATPSWGDLVIAPAKLEGSRIPVVLLSIWTCGFAASVVWWSRKWLKLRRVLRHATPVNLNSPLPVMCSPARLEPGVFGIFKPVLLLPEGITDRLSPAELKSVLAHELCHARRRDNLASAIHMFVEAVFWFHPLVWWIKARLLEEQERVCDEEVLELGGDPRVYAESILKICEFYLTSPLICVSGIAGSDLKRRIEEIMSARVKHNLSFGRALLLAWAAITVAGAPIAAGSVRASEHMARFESTIRTMPPTIGMEASTPEVQAPRQQPFAPLLAAQARDLTHFDVVSVRPAEPFEPVAGAPPGAVPTGSITGGIGTSDPGRITYRGVWLNTLLSTAYSLRSFQLAGPAWLGQERYDIVATIPAGATKEQFRLMLQNLLHERFNLSFHRESKTFPVYALTLGKNGVKLQESSKADASPLPAGTVFREDDKGFLSFPPGYSGAAGRPVNGRMYFSGQRVTLGALISMIESPLAGVDNPIVDETGLTGEYDFKLEFEWRRPGASSDPASAPSIFSVLEKELGLKLEEKRVPFDVLVIDRLDRLPTPN